MISLQKTHMFAVKHLSSLLLFLVLMLTGSLAAQAESDDGVAGDGSHVITWEDGEDPPAAVILRRQADGSGWRVERGERE